MLNVSLDDSGAGLQLLLLGAHCDDIEIGCGGALLKLLELYRIEEVRWVVFTSNPARKTEALKSAEAMTESIAHKKIQIHDYDDGFLPAAWSTVKKEFEAIKKSFTPNVILTHYRNDLHQDHRVVNELTWNTFRNDLIFEYEIPKYDGDMGNPNFYVTLEKNHVQKKKDLILNHFQSQRQKHWLDEELLTSMMRIRGMQCASDSGYAEGFYSRKMTL